MLYRVKRFSVVQLGVVMAGVNAVAGVLAFLFTALASLASGQVRGLALAFGMLILYPLMGFVAGVIGAFIYNLVASFTGGVELTLEEQSG